MQRMPSLSNVGGLLGSVIPSNAWIHVTLPYSQVNRRRAYNDVQMSVPTMNTAPIVCRISGIPYASGLYVGGIDEFRIYNRSRTG